MRRVTATGWRAVAAAAVLAACTAAPPADGTPADGAVPVIEPVVLGELGHDPAAWTQGLQADGADLYEGTGESASQLRQLDPATGDLLRSAATPHGYYGEGITVVGPRIWQLTWRDGVAVEWDRATLTPLREVPVAGEGWGLCFDGTRLVRSDGSDRLRFHDPNDFTETGSVAVTRDGRPVGGLNELECVDGQVWANVWYTDTLVRIDPGRGVVTAVVDATALADAARGAGGNILNGIAHLRGDEYLLTGKHWPAMYRVRLEVPGPR